MLDFTTVDIIIVGLILFLSLKGLVNGFMKEILSFIGLIGGVALASRLNTKVGEFINANVLPIENDPALKLAGFVAVLLGVWLIANMLASLIGGSDEEVGFISRILGYGVSIVRYIAIFGLIFASVQDVDLLAKKLEKHAQGSQLIAPLQQIGEKLLNMPARQANEQRIDLDTYNFDINHSNVNQQ